MVKLPKRQRKFAASGGVKKRLEKGTITKKGKLRKRQRTDEDGKSKLETLPATQRDRSDDFAAPNTKSLAGMELDDFFSQVSDVIEHKEEDKNDPDESSEKKSSKKVKIVEANKKQKKKDEASESSESGGDDDEEEDEENSPSKGEKQKPSKSGSSSSSDSEDSDDEDVEVAEKRMKAQMAKLTKSDNSKSFCKKTTRLSWSLEKRTMRWKSNIRMTMMKTRSVHLKKRFI
jgi:hypothetical protein